MWKSAILHCVMAMAKPEIIRGWNAIDLIHKDPDTFLINWVRRIVPLTDEQLEKGKFN